MRCELHGQRHHRKQGCSNQAAPPASPRLDWILRGRQDLMPRRRRSPEPLLVFTDGHAVISTGAASGAQGRAGTGPGRLYPTLPLQRRPPPIRQKSPGRQTSHQIFAELDMGILLAFSPGYALSGILGLLQEGRLFVPEKRGAKLGTGETEPKLYKPKTDRSAFRDERSGHRACG